MYGKKRRTKGSHPLIKIAVVGAGAIGARLDSPQCAVPLTHAGAAIKAGLSLVALVDVAPDLEDLSREWNCRPYRDFRAMMQAEKPEIISLSVPTGIRKRFLLEALEFKPSVVIAEKPLTINANEAADVVEKYRD